LDRLLSSPDIIVIGNGLFGSATTRHLAERGHDVLNIGAASSGPDVRGIPEAQWPTHRVYSSHNDAARLTRLQDRDPAWADVTARAVDGYRRLEEASGITFFHDVGCLIVSRPGGDGVSADPIEVMNETGVGFTFYEPGDPTWRGIWPSINFPDTHYVAFESSPAGYIQPKRLIAAQNTLAERAGAAFLVDTVSGISRTDDRFSVKTASGDTHRGAKVVVCAGAFTNFNGMLPEPAPVSLKSEVVILGEVTEADALSLADSPTVKYLIDVSDLESIYMVPPVRYEDGRYYIKMGANTSLDQPMTELDKIQEWFNSDTDPEYLPIFEPALRSLWPTVEFVSVRTQPCLITYSPDRVPIIEHQGDGLFVATAGNGGGAKGSDAWGERTAELVERS
jgi:sarcosine oxidase